MSTLEKKLCTAIDGLIDEVVRRHPTLIHPLKKIRRVLREMAS